MTDTPTKSWQARISEATDAIAQEFVESISYDWRLYKHDIAGSIAHATMLAKVGLISDADRDAIVKGLKEIEAEIDRDGPKWTRLQVGAGRHPHVRGERVDRPHRRAGPEAAHGTEPERSGGVGFGLVVRCVG